MGFPAGPYDALRRIAYLLERSRAGSYRVKAFRGAAATVLATDPAELASRAAEGTLGDLPGIGPATEAVAAVIVKALESSRPRSRYVVTSAAKAMINLRRFGGDRVWDSAMRKRLGL